MSMPIEASTLTPRYDYANCDMETRLHVQRRTEAIHGLVKKSAETIIAIGEALIDVKDRLPHGSFRDWLAAEFDWNAITAAKYMNIARKYTDSVHLPSQSTEALALLAAPSTPESARLEASEAAQQHGGGITLAHTREIVEHRRAEHEQDAIDAVRGYFMRFSKPQRVKEILQNIRKGNPSGIRHLDAIRQHTSLTFGYPILKKACATLLDEGGVDGWFVEPEAGRGNGSADIEAIVHADPPHREPTAYEDDPFFDEDDTPIGRNKHTHATGNNEWYTPPEYIEAARAVMGEIDLDPASSVAANEWVRANVFVSEEQDGLSWPWFGRIWLNPPYEQPTVTNFCRRVVETHESSQIEQACVLVNNGTETVYGQALLGRCDAVCFPSSRIRFLLPDGSLKDSPLQGQMIVYFGDRSAEFKSVFSKFGVVL